MGRDALEYREVRLTLFSLWSASFLLIENLCVAFGLGLGWSADRKMSVAEYDYLRNLPLAIHVPSMHTFLVHGGMLPSDPTRDIHNSRQPLAHLPTLQRASKDTDVLREAQELSILTDVPQNNDPWTLLNVRDITKKGKVSRKGGDGTPWAELWNQIQSLCSGFDYSGFGPVSPADMEEMKKKKLPW